MLAPGRAAADYLAGGTAVDAAAYDPVGNLVELASPAGAVTAYSYWENMIAAEFVPKK